MNDKKTLSIWLLPDRSIVNYKSIIGNISKSLNSVEIIPHITLISSFNNSKNYSIQKLQGILSNQAPFTLEPEKIDVGNTYFQSLCVTIKVDPIIRELRNKSLEYFKCKEKNCYKPHMSLAYGKHKKSEKDGVIDKSVKSLLDHKITISSVAIAENDEYNLKWKIIEKVYLND
jgi:hypothetical protein